MYVQESYKVLYSLWFILQVPRVDDTKSTKFRFRKGGRKRS